MKLTLPDFRFVSFHDSPVRSIEESLTGVRIVFDFGMLRPPLIDGLGQWRLIDCSLECVGVQRSEKEEWSDTVIAKPHSTPERPLEEVSHEEIVGGCLQLSGFTQSKCWGVWRIAAQEFVLTWKARHEH